ncbi:MAG: glutamate--tRNA ligase [Pseudomonadota bacterium]
MSSPVVTRFAPSPTGFLHIGGARTALFNWLFSRHHGGKMLLRIEDTDRARSTDEAIDAILDGLNWLGLEPDEEPVYQHTRAERHREMVEKMLAEGNAYRCFCTPEELHDMRETARAEGRAPVYDGTWRDRDPADAPAGAPYSVRLRAPRDGETTIADLVQGDVTWANDQLDDLILLRSDGSPTYMLSVVVDDHDMGITHVIRGDDHLTNAARQTQIFRAAGWETPAFAHIPLIHGPDGAKLSKRHGALGVEAYRAMGYLPEAMRNYLVRLGWSHGDEEVFSTEQAIEWFGLGAVGRSPSRFDFAKLEAVNFEHLRGRADERLLEDLMVFLPHAERGAEVQDNLNEENLERLKLAMPALKERSRTLNDLISGASFVFAKRPLKPDEKAAKLLDSDARQILGRLVSELEVIGNWSHESAEAAVRAFVEANGLKLGKVGPPLRAALTGTTNAPGIFDVLAILGQAESCARIRDQIS